MMFSPSSVSGVHDTPPIPPSISKCLQELKTTKLNQSQQNAINSMLDPACQQVPLIAMPHFSVSPLFSLDPISSPGSIWLWQDPHSA